MKIYVDGYGIVAHSIIRKLIENHEILSNNLLVNTYKLKENSEFIEFLENNNIKYFQSAYSNSKVKYLVNEFSPDIIASIYGRRLIPNMILNLARKGTFNLHPSLLPKYKGCFSCPWAIINMEQTTGVTFHEMSSSIDSGSILYQKKINIDYQETGYSLWHKAASEFISRFDDFFQKYRNDEHVIQNMPNGGTYYPRALPFNGVINTSWNEKKIDHFIRALFFPPFRSAQLKLGNEFIEIDTLERFLEVF